MQPTGRGGARLRGGGPPLSALWNVGLCYLPRAVTYGLLSRDPDTGNGQVSSHEGGDQLGRRVVTADDITLGEELQDFCSTRELHAVRGAAWGGLGVVRFVPRGPDTGAQVWKGMPSSEP